MDSQDMEVAFYKKNIYRVNNTIYRKEENINQYSYDENGCLRSYWLSKQKLTERINTALNTSGYWFKNGELNMIVLHLKNNGRGKKVLRKYFNPHELYYF